MIDAKQLATQVRQAERVATSPERLQELLHAYGVQVAYSRRGKENLVDGWKLRPANGNEEDWLKGSDITSDRHFSWPKLARRKGWPLPQGRRAGGSLTQIEQDSEPPIAPAKTLEFLLPPEVTKPKPFRDRDQEMVEALEELALLVARLAHAVQQAVVRLVNALLRAVGVDYQLQVRQGMLPGRAGTGQAKNEQRDTALQSVRAMIDALKTRDCNQLPAAPSGDADAVAARSELASELAWRHWLDTSQPAELERKARDFAGLRPQDMTDPWEFLMDDGAEVTAWFEGLEVARNRARARLAGLIEQLAGHSKSTAETPGWNLLAKVADRKTAAELAAKIEAARVARAKAERAFEAASKSERMQRIAEKKRALAQRFTELKRVNDARLEQIRERLEQLKADAKSLKLRPQPQPQPKPLDELVERQAESVESADSESDAAEGEEIQRHRG